MTFRYGGDVFAEIIVHVRWQDAHCNAEGLVRHDQDLHQCWAAATTYHSLDLWGGRRASLLWPQLRDLLVKYRDVFRLSFGQDPPIRVEPLRVRVRDGATPVRFSVRRYQPAHMQYLDQHVGELLASGLAYTYPSSRWATPPRIVAKQEPGSYRTTVETRAVNERTDPIQWPMPVLESALGMLEKATCYFTLDWLDSQGMSSIMTDRGIITPTRVLMGGTDAVAYCSDIFLSKLNF
ncbi:unnamed protein product [Phytophthora fragariaefolia]|uniref:Unnamed protein product n=1 Tax=Phytophthora fragariaefolia TaxID=1490495 RepID=A0A9W6X5I7_9STRA|nr:unnamed protein product [Phytophthora fragariaefolia]